MTHLDFAQTAIKNLITHHIGNKINDEKCTLTNEYTTCEDETREFLLTYFLLPFKTEEFFCFNHAVSLDLNEVYTIAKSIFSDDGDYITSTQSLAKLLYESSSHPKIKEGELNIAYLTNIVIGGKVVDAIGIFKSETDAAFLKMRNQKSKFNIIHDFGFEMNGVDKGCIIFNIEEENGYKILISDNTNRSAEAQYWKDDFLNLKPVADEFHQTSQFLGIAKNFVTTQLAEEFEVSKADKIDLLNRSVAYFKKHESFDKAEFEEEVFQDKDVIKSFRNFDCSFREEHDIELTDQFDISPQAVKKQARVFKSVLKLDKNFHIYIHGNKNLIEQGVEQDGRKFYKIYFEKEL